MSDVNTTDTIFIREDTALPATLSIKSDAFLPGWRVVKNLDGYALARKIEDANWNLFCLAGDLRVTVLGRDRPGTFRRAVRRLLAKQQGQQLNCLEITKGISQRFLGIPFLRVSAHSRHIQESMYLLSAKEFVLGIPVAAAPRAELDSGGQQHHGEVATKPYTALISSS